MVLEIWARLCQTSRERQGRLGDTWFLDELFVRINDQQEYLWRAVDQDGDVIDILLQSRRDQRSAERLLRRLLRGRSTKPFRIITDKLKSYAAAIERSCQALPTIRNNMPTIEPRFHINPAHERTTNAPIQISTASSALSVAPRSSPEFILS